MKNMTLKNIAAICGGIYHGNDADSVKEISGVSIDSRNITKGCLFAALKGKRADGHDFIRQAIKNGAVCALSEKELPDASFACITVPSCAQALKDLALHYRNSFDIKVVAISGSVGKTSAKEMIASVLCQKFRVLKTEGNLNNEIGLPLSVFKIKEEHEIAVFELGISHFGDMEPLAKIAEPDLCVITNIGCAHLEFFKTREGILKEKTDMFRFMKKGGGIVLNGDDEMLSGFSPAAGGTSPVFFGLSDKCDYRALEIRDLGFQGTIAKFHTPDFDFYAHIKAPGAHMVYNALAASAAGHIFGVDADGIRAGIEAVRPVPGRDNIINSGQINIIDGSYNANPDSMKTTLDLLAKAKGRKVAVLGDMLELGENKKRMHKEVGRYAALLPVDLLICIGELSKDMADGAENAGGPAKVLRFASKKDFIKSLDSVIHKGDTVLVKASLVMGFSQIVEKLKNI